MTTLAEICGERLRVALKMTGKTQGDVCRAVGITRVQMSNLCRGKYTPRVYYLVDICRYLNVSADFILGFTDEMKGAGK